ncbi:MAG: alpha/beta fold hydrolase, partial [Phycicoccus sp.]
MNRTRTLVSAVLVAAASGATAAAAATSASPIQATTARDSVVLTAQPSRDDRTAPLGHSEARDVVDATLAGTPDRTRVPAGFTEHRTRVGEVRLNYVVGGRGPTLVLLHGYPQNWTMWRKVLPALAEHYTVVAPDLRGAGRSDAPREGYDKKTLAADVHGLLAELGLDRDVRVLGHDIGTMVAYAYAAAHPEDVTRLVLSEAPIPDEGIY